MAGKATITFYDRLGKPTSMSVNTAQPAGDIDVLATAVETLQVALENIVESGEVSRTLSRIDATGTPASRAGFRGTKALVRWFSANEGDGGQYGSNEIGAVDPNLFTVVGNRAILQGANYNAIQSAFDGLVVTENGNAVAVYEIELVSRSI